NAFVGTTANVFRGMTTLALGVAVARGIGIIAIPVLTRLYTPEDFGALSVFVAVIAILAPILSLRYVAALPLPRRNSTAANLFVLSMGLIGINTLILGCLLWAFGGVLLSLFSMQVLSD